MFQPIPSLILASQSPRRKQLLEWAKIPFEIKIIPTNEAYPAHLPIASIPIFIAEKKAVVVQDSFAAQEHIILAADTIVAIDSQIIGKPIDRADAIEKLTRLQGRTHEVWTGVCLLYKGKKISFSEATRVEFYPMSIDQIAWYVDTYQPYDKAGAYAIQEWIGVVGIKKIEGDFYNVMGLPISKVVRILQSWEKM